MDNGKNRLADFVGIKLDLSRDAVTAAWLALQTKGKQKGKDLQVVSRIREAILADQTVDEKTGSVSWSAAELSFRTDDDFTAFAKAVNKLVDEDGVDPGLSTAALELQAKVEAKVDDLKAAKKAAPEAAVVKT